MNGFFSKEWVLKPASILVSLILWIYVVYFNSPETEKWIRDIPVTKTNVSSDFENGKLTITESNSETVDVKVRGNRRTVAALNNSNVTVTADMIGALRSGAYTLTTRVGFPVDNVSAIAKEPRSYDIVIDDVDMVEMEVTVETMGNLQEGFIVDNAVITPSIMRLTGPHSVIKKVDKAVITVDLTNGSTDIKGSYKVKLYSGNEEFTDASITQNIKYVDVLYTILTTKSVAVKPDVKNADLRPDVKITAEIESDKRITLKGKPEALSGITEIYTQEIDAAGITDGQSKEVELSFPDGVVPIDESGKAAKVTFGVKNIVN